VADREHSYGAADASVVLTEFGDFQCPYCRAASGELRALVDGSDGRIRLVFRHFPLFDVHPYALTAALAAEAAGAAGRFWEMHDQLFAHQDHLTDVDLARYAVAIGVDGTTVVGDAAQQHADAVEADYAAGLAAGVAGTPTLFVDGEPYEGSIERDALSAAVLG
jgi:protein-disulfide isomerase